MTVIDARHVYLDSLKMSLVSMQVIKVKRIYVINSEGLQVCQAKKGSETLQ